MVTLVAVLSGAAPVKLGKSIELAKIPLGDEAHEFVLGIGACRKGECPVEVRYGGKALKMEWPATQGIAKAESKTRWQLGDDSNGPEYMMQLDAAALELTDDLNAVLVTLTSGFEHVHQQHALFTVTKRGLEKVYAVGTGAGPQTTTVKLHGQGEVLVTTTMYSPDPDTADLFGAVKLQWAKAAGKFDQVPAAAPAIVSKPMPFSAGRAAQVTECLKDFLVLDSQSVTGLGPQEVVVAKPYGAETTRANAAAEARQCAPKLSFQPGLLESKPATAE